MLDILAIDDITDPEQVGDGPSNAVRALARRLLQPDDANESIGDEEPIETLDLNDYLGDSLLPEDERELEADVERCIADDERVARVDEVRVTNSASVLGVKVSGAFRSGVKFSFDLTIDRITTAVLFEATT